jgi:hypothetical protein
MMGLWKVRGNFGNKKPGWREGLALAFALVVGGMWGNGKCQKRGRESLRLRCGGNIGRIVIRQPYPLSHFILFSLVPHCNETESCPRGETLLVGLSVVTF